MYHEFVYLSGDKVQQFVPAKAWWWQRLRAKKAGAALKVSPVEASLEVEPSEIGGDERKLRKLIEYLEESGRCYTDEGVGPGEWVMFEGRIGLAHVESPPDRGGVLFCEAERADVTTPRILLHGSGRHLMAAGRSTPPGGETETQGGYSLPTGAVDLIEKLTGSGTEQRSRDFWLFFGRSDNEGHDFERKLSTFFQEVACTAEFRDFAPYLGGHARVTAVVHPRQLPFPVVLASPLYVRYERP
ncbi:SAVMC3_10250 family protein [Nocardia xishanensis]|uniref:SAVMC3_10250 family protein n=1 Tax=Nocardia xishanensis TaxID=238964 RepID=UPI003448B8C2